jgi:acyl-ACP thioesterase
MNCNPANPKGTGVVNVWQETFPVRFGEIDKSDKLTLDAVFKFFQEAAISHAENLGVGREDMASKGQGWVLSRMSVLVDRRPAYCENITIRSWPCGFEKLFAIRDYQIIGNDEKAVVSARSAWLVVDIEKRRPLRPQSVMEFLPLNEGQGVFSPDVGAVTGLADRGNLQKIEERKALYNDLDFNGHVNNISYIKWIEDALDLQVLEKAGKMRLDINYISEIMGGEMIDILFAPIDDTAGTAFAFAGQKKENGQMAFKVELRLWE